MIEARKIKLENNKIFFEYKYELTENYVEGYYDLDKKILYIDNEDITERERYHVYAHLIIHLIDQIKENKLQDTFKNVWY